MHVLLPEHAMNHASVLTHISTKTARNKFAMHVLYNVC